jgi:hypothetical protein
MVKYKKKLVLESIRFKNKIPANRVSENTPSPGLISTKN